MRGSELVEARSDGFLITMISTRFCERDFGVSLLGF